MTLAAPEVGSAWQTGALGVLSPIRHERMSAAIVRNLRDLIREGRLRPGDRLPPEVTLAEMFGVSRVTIRDALRVLESGGLVSIRVGARGGVTVTAPKAAVLAETMVDMVATEAITPSEVEEARRSLADAVIGQACENASDDELEELARLLALRAALTKADVAILVAPYTHNRALQLLAAALHQTEQRTQSGALRPSPVQRHTSAELADALRRRESGRARDLLSGDDVPAPPRRAARTQRARAPRAIPSA